jgi:hypothetical protein
MPPVPSATLLATLLPRDRVGRWLPGIAMVLAWVGGWARTAGVPVRQASDTAP